VHTHEDHHIMSYGKLFAVLIILLILTGVTVLTSYVDLGKLNVWAALLIASAKGTCVLLFFMHLKYEGKLIVYSFISTIFFSGYHDQFYILGCGMPMRLRDE